MARKVLGKRAAGHNFSQGVIAPPGRLVFVSGQAARGHDGQIVAEGDVEGQIRYVFQRIDEILREDGGSLDDVVKITTFMIDIDMYEIFNRVRADVFGDDFPASSAFAVTALVEPEFLVEVEAIAILPNG